MLTKHELTSLPHIVLTSDVEWDPTTYDKDIDNLNDFHDPSEDDHENYHFDQHGEYRHWTVATHNTRTEDEFYDACKFLDFDDQVDKLMDALHPELVSSIYSINSSEVTKVSPKFDLRRPLFGWAPADNNQEYLLSDNPVCS
jgi:hypothetical protein